MKKYFSNIFALAALLMAGAAFTACSSDDNSIEQPANPVGEKTYTLTINASKGANASTRALKLETSGALTAYWENGDELSVLNYTQMADLSGVLTAKNANGATATFSGTLTGTIAVGDKLHLFYHQPTGIDDYKAQTGTLASAAALDYAVANVTVASVEGGEITISETSASFLTQTPMLKLTLTDGTNKLNATQLKVSATMTVASLPMTEDIATFTLPEATYTTNGDGILYFALPSKMNVAAALVDKIKAKVPTAVQSLVTIDAVMTALDGATLTYTATVGSDTYTATKDNGYTFAAGKYYAGTLTMKKALTYPIALSAVTSDYIGSVIASDGNVYPAKTAVPAGKTAVGILGKVTATGHGLILALKDATGQVWNTINGWTSVNTYAGTTLKVLPDAARGSLASYTTLGETTVSNWAVAQKSDYEAIFTNLGSTTGDDDGMTYDANVNAYITTGVGGTKISDGYWSATEDVGGDAWGFEKDFWVSGTKTFMVSVRPVLGF